MHALAAALLIALAFGRSVAQTPSMLAPSGVAYDTAGNLFIADTQRNQVYEITLGGAVSIVAGTGEQGFGGDNGPAIAAELNAPQGLAMASDGTLYIADTGNQRIRAVSHGVIATFAGTGVRGDSGEDALAPSAKLNTPTALAIDANGALLICDTGSHRVRRVSAGTISALAGSGVQGFAGDGGKATAALLDSPTGIATLADGRTVIADSHNHRLRVVGADGLIQTFAGTGVRGFSGDGGAATSATLMLPRGVTVTKSGNVLFADSDNHRIRSIDAQGIITTVAGDGWQASSAPDGQAANIASLNVPKFAAATPYGVVTFADPHASSVSEVASDSGLYIVAAPAAAQPLRKSAITLDAPKSVTYGQGTASLAVSGSAAKPLGTVTILDSGTVLSTNELAGDASSMSLQSLPAGTHTLSAIYSGDGLNPSATSQPFTTTIEPAEIVATANAVSIIYGQNIAPLTGSSSGILPQDASSVTVGFASTAGPLAAVGTYPITATLAGSAAGNYAIKLAAGSGSLTVAQAPSTLSLQTPSQTGYAGLPLVLSANVRPAYTGVPSGDVVFSENGNIIARTVAVNGIASATYLSPTAGAHIITASYAGDGNFLASTSSPLSISVASIPDFTFTTTTATQSVQSGLIASYALVLTPLGGPFTGSVSFSVSGLPSGASATFSPALVVPGASGANVTLDLQTPATIASQRNSDGTLGPIFACLPALYFAASFRRKRFTLLAVFALALATLSCIGCGERTVSSGKQSSHSYTLTVTATSTDLAGKLVTHTLPLTLVVQ